MYEKPTDELLKLLQNTHNPKDLDFYRTQYTAADGQLSFASRFNQILDKKHRSKADIIKGSLLDRTYAYQILNGTKTPGRNKILALSISAGCSFQEIQQLLECAKEGILYSRSSRDAVIIYGIQQHLSLMEINELLCEKQEAVIE